MSSGSWLIGIIFVIVTSVVCHILFSSLGYNPSDDGFILSGARRILWGEIPHKDFITIRPFLPYLLHAPIVYFGGDYTYWLSRLFVLLQLSITAWFCVLITENVLETKLSQVKKFVFALFAFMYGVHDFPIMAWYSIDAIFFATLGLWFSLQKNSSQKFIGYILIGLSPLARQNFLLVGPVSLFILGDYKKLRYWLASFLPLFIMGVYLLIVGALPDAILQMTAHNELFLTGFLKYYRTKAFLQGIVFGTIAMYFSLSRVKVSVIKGHSSLQKSIGTFLILFGLLYAAYSTIRPDTYNNTGAFFIFGMIIGIAGFIFLEAPQYLSYAKLAVLLAPVAWSVSISLGYNTPALATGGLVVLLLAFLTTDSKGQAPDLRFIAICLLLIPTLFIFKHVRENQIYEEQPAQTLTYRLDGIYPGGINITTNKRTYTFLLDLQKAIKIVGNREFAILPDTPGYWAAAPQKNPLPIDWPNTGELHTKPLMDRTIAVLKEKRGKIVIIMQKINTVELARKDEPVDLYSSPLLVYVAKHYKKTVETELFTLYQ